MKKLLAIAMLCFLATTAMGQATSLRVENTTPCNAYYTVYARSLPCPFVGAVASVTITLPPFATVVYPSSAALGLPPNMFIIAADAYNRLPSPPCVTPVTTWTVGDPCTGFPPIMPIYSMTACTVCAQFYAEWRPAPTSGGMAELLFHF